MSDFLNHYKVHNGFKYDCRFTPIENFKALIRHLNIQPKSNAYYSLLRESKCNYYRPFFDNFIHFNGFIYFLNLTPKKNFLKLINHMGIDLKSRDYLTLYEKFKDFEDNDFIDDSFTESCSEEEEDSDQEPSEEEIQFGKKENERMLSQVKKRKTVADFFGYFESNHNFFSQSHDLNSLHLFKKLSAFMKFDYIYYRYLKYFDSLSSYEEEIFLRRNFNRIDTKYDPSFKFDKSFNY